MNSNRTFLLALYMFFGALVLQFFPIAGQWIFLKPNFLLLMMIAWMLYFPDQFGIEFAVIMGFIADFIFVTTLGLHILIFSICGLILIFFHRIVVYLQLMHRIILVFLMILLVEFLHLTFDITPEKPVSIQGILLLAVISALCWIPLDKFVEQVYSRQK